MLPPPALALTLVLAGCGAAGAPRPPGPPEAGAPSLAQPRRGPGGWRVHVQAPTTDVDGAPLPADAPRQIALYAGDRPCAGRPLGIFEPGKAVALPPEGGTFTVAVLVGGRPGRPSRLHVPAYTSPPPAPEPPLVQRRPDAAVDLTWLPNETPGAETVLLRNGSEVGRFAGDVATFTDRDAPVGPVTYTLRCVGPDFSTAVSPPATVP